MRRIFVVSIAAAALPAVFYLISSRLNTPASEVVPARPVKQATVPGGTIPDPAVRAALEKEYQRVLTLRKEALRQAEARLKREAEEERREVIADEQQAQPSRQNATTPMIQKSTLTAPGSFSPPKHQRNPRDN